MAGNSLAMLSLHQSFLIYAILFKLAIITAGAIAMFLGYRLISTSGENIENSRTEGVSVKLKAGAASLFIRNTTSGVVFALFGMIIISVMIWRGTPQFEQTAAPDPNQPGIRMRGDDARRPGMADMIREGRAMSQSGEPGASEQYQEALSLLTQAANERACDYFEQGQRPEALLLAQFAVTLNPCDANALDTLAQVLVSLDRKSEALRHAEAAAKLDPGRYGDAWTRLRNELEQP